LPRNSRREPVYLPDINPTRKAAMSRLSITGTFEECADELSEFVNTLRKYPHAVLAFALRAHLSGLLQALLLQGHWSRADVAAFLDEMQTETLHPE
jgi:hypothetical protein